MNSVHCKVFIPKVEGLEEEVLSVGRHFTLKCSGEWSKEFDFSQAAFVAEGINPLQLKVFASQAVDIESFEIDATVYAPMSIQSGSVMLSDSKNQILLNHDQIKIESIQSATESNGAQAGPPKPYGFFIGKMDWPLFYGIVVASMIAVVVGLILIGVNRRRYWRKLELGLREYDSPLAPDSQAYRTLRVIEKSIRQLDKNTDQKIVSETHSQLQNCIYLYILRRYQVPIFQLKNMASNRKLNSFLKARWPRLKNQRRQIFHFMNDLSALQIVNPAEQNASMQKIMKRFYEFIESSETLFKSVADRNRRGLS